MIGSRIPEAARGLRNAPWAAVVARALSIAASFTLVAVSSRGSSAALAGTFFALMAVSVAGSTIGRFGTDVVGLKLAGAGMLDRNSFTLLARFCLVRAAVASAGAAAISPYFVSRGVAGELPGELYFDVFVATWFGAVAVFLGSILRGLGRVSRGTWVESGIAPTAAVAYLMVQGGGLSLVDMLRGLAAGQVVATACGIAWLRAVELAACGDARSLVGRSAEGSRAAIATTAVLFYLLTYAPVLTLGARGLHEDAAFYTLAARVANLIGLVAVLQSSYLAPQIAAAARIPFQINRIAVRAARVGLIVGGPMGAVLILSPHIMDLAFGSQYGQTAYPMRILAIGAVLTIAFGPVNAVMLICDREGLSTVLNATLVMVTVGGIWSVSPSGGVAAVAWISAGASAAYAATAAAALRRLDGIRTVAWAPLAGRASDKSHNRCTGGA